MTLPCWSTINIFFIFPLSFISTGSYFYHLVIWNRNASFSGYNFRLRSTDTVLLIDSFLWILCFTKLQTSFWLLRQFFFSFLLMANKYRHEHIYYHQIAITARRIQFSTTTLLVLLMFFHYCALYTYYPWLSRLVSTKMPYILKKTPAESSMIVLSVCNPLVDTKR